MMSITRFGFVYKTKWKIDYEDMKVEKYEKLGFRRKLHGPTSQLFLTSPLSNLSKIQDEAHR